MNQISPATLVLTPEAVSQMLRIVAPEGPIRVHGFAKGVKTWPKDNPKYCFGLLTLNEAFLDFKVPVTAAPKEGDAVVLDGVLEIRPANPSRDAGFPTHKVQLNGSVVAGWTPTVAAVAPVELQSRFTRLPLAAFLENNDISSLVILASATARGDIVSVLNKEKIVGEPQFVDARFDDAQAFLKQLRDRGVSGKAIALARGGGPGQDVVGDCREIISELISTGLPFYSAIGHARDVSLIDRYADQPYSTPSELAAAISSAVRTAARWRHLQREVKELNEKAAASSGRRVSIAQLSIAIAVAALAFWLLGRFG